MRIIMDHPWIFISILIFLAILLIFCLIRAIKGPTISDRVVAVNMMGTIVMVIIAMLALYMKESYLLDICLIYAMISFLAVVVLTKVYSGVYLEKIAKARKQQAESGQEQESASETAEPGKPKNAPEVQEMSGGKTAPEVLTEAPESAKAVSVIGKENNQKAHKKSAEVSETEETVPVMKYGNGQKKKRNGKKKPKNTKAGERSDTSC